MTNIQNYHRLRSIGRFLGIIVITGILAYVILHNAAPYGAMVYYSSSKNDGNRIAIGPKERVQQKIQQNETIFEQTHDIIYFATKMPLQFDEATIRLTFNNPNPKQILFIGFQDKPIWHYEKKLFDVPFLNDLSWDVVGNEPTLYQRKKYFSSVEDFLKETPEQALIGTYEYDTNIGKFQPHILNYTPSQQETIIDTPLRGKHILYVYLKNEPFRMTFTKQDLNWYEDPDTVTVKIYKDDVLVNQEIIADDGIVDTTRKTLAPQEMTIANTGPDLPENGVYKVIIDANDDTIIHRITTNLHKIVFSGQLFLAQNHDSYPTVIASTSASTLYTNALMFSGITYHHAGQQQLLVGDQLIEIHGIENEQTIIPEQRFTQITATKNDLILNMFDGYSVFSPEQFFLPTMYHIFPVTKKSDTTLADYLIADYRPAQREGGWLITTRTFNINSAFIKNNQLNWAIIAPRLHEKKKTIQIKKIEVTLKKKKLF